MKNKIYSFILPALLICAFATGNEDCSKIEDFIMLEKNILEATSHNVPDIQELVTAWSQFLQNNPWQDLIKNIAPFQVGCGTVYELPNFLNRPNEDFAIVDMREIQYAEPHYHPENDYEIYFVLQGTAIVVVGKVEHHVKAGDVVIIPPSKAHFTIPDEKYVIACVNTPPYNPAHYIKLTESNEAVEFDKGVFDQLITNKILRNASCQSSK